MVNDPETRKKLKKTRLEFEKWFRKMDKESKEYDRKIKKIHKLRGVK